MILSPHLPHCPQHHRTSKSTRVASSLIPSVRHWILQPTRDASCLASSQPVPHGTRASLLPSNWTAQHSAQSGSRQRSSRLHCQILSMQCRSRTSIQCSGQKCSSQKCRSQGYCALKHAWLWSSRQQRRPRHGAAPARTAQALPGHCCYGSSLHAETGTCGRGLGSPAANNWSRGKCRVNNWSRAKSRAQQVRPAAFISVPGFSAAATSNTTGFFKSSRMSNTNGLSDANRVPSAGWSGRRRVLACARKGDAGAAPENTARQGGGGQDEELWEEDELEEEGEADFEEGALDFGQGDAAENEVVAAAASAQEWTNLPDDEQEENGATFNLLDLTEEELIRLGAAAAESGEGAEEEEEEEEDEGTEFGGKYPKPPLRACYLADLFFALDLDLLAHQIDLDHRDVLVTGLTNDITKVQQGDVFFCYTVPHVDIEPTVWGAIAMGAAAVICEEEVEGMPMGFPIICTDEIHKVQGAMAAAFYGHPSKAMRVVGVGGSLGKTTVGWLVRGILEEQGQSCGLVGSIEHAMEDDRLDNDGNIWQPEGVDPVEERESSAAWHLSPFVNRYVVEEDTPNSLHLQKVMAGMRDRGAQCAVLEASTGALQLDTFEAVDMDVGVFTNLQYKFREDPDITTFEEYRQAQLRLFESLQDASRQVGVVNVDDSFSTDILAACQEVPTVTFGIDSPDADVSITKMDLRLNSTRLVVNTPLGELEVELALPGRHNVYNILAAVATAIAMRVDLQTIKSGLEAVEMVPGRAEVIAEGQQFAVMVDAANNPAALSSLLDSVRECGAIRVFVVVGCPGEWNADLRADVGRVVHAKADLVVLTNDSPRGEDPHRIIQDMVAGFPEQILNKSAGMAYWCFQDQGRVPLWFEPYLQKMQRYTRRYIMEDRFSAIRCAIGTATEGDVVIIAGRGHLDYVHHDDGEGSLLRGWFDDRVECRNALSKLSYLERLEKLDRSELPWGNTLDDDFPDVIID